MQIAAYRNKETGQYPISAEDIRSMSQFGYGAGEPPASVLDELKMEPVFGSIQPPFDPTTHYAVEAAPLEAERGWFQAWSVLPLTPPENTPYLVPIPVIKARALEIGVWSKILDYLGARPALGFEVLSVSEGIDPAHPELAKAFDLLGVPQEARDFLLARP